MSLGAIWAASGLIWLVPAAMAATESIDAVLAITAVFLVPAMALSLVVLL